MEYLYVFIHGSEWENMIVFLSLDDAIKASIKYPEARVEIFSKKYNEIGYRPSYNYYENGKYIKKT